MVLQKEHDNYKLCAKSRFGRFFVHHLENSKYWSFRTYKPIGRHTRMVLRKKCDGHKLYAKSRFDRFFTHRQKFKIMTIPNVLAHAQELKILAIPNVLAHGKLYEHGFIKRM
ncbi:hypothetical protein BHE74_00023433 [Ensete ventricosum]|nr:hypothetical protein GW17_00026341 [Ensete ventricosum]RWW69002.1 hypothetical protein BHE74_00023433 [Ensete ventricosum]RZS01865.1 hypothetical protein BHM03_00031807 [Ensete ventricosum]